MHLLAHDGAGLEPILLLVVAHLQVIVDRFQPIITRIKEQFSEEKMEDRWVLMHIEGITSLLLKLKMQTLRQMIIYNESLSTPDDGRLAASYIEYMERFDIISLAEIAVRG